MSDRAASSFMVDGTKQPGQTQGYENTTRLENHDPLGNSIFGQISSRVRCRTRGFSVRHQKYCPDSGDFDRRAGVFGRRVAPTTTNVNAGGVAHVAG